MRATDLSKKDGQKNPDQKEFMWFPYLFIVIFGAVLVYITVHAFVTPGSISLLPDAVMSKVMMMTLMGGLMVGILLVLAGLFGLWATMTRRQATE